MNHDVFISYSSRNKYVADAVVHCLEENKIRCWIAPRDIIGGAEYADVITDAIKCSKIFILVYSEYAAISRFCKQETNLALSSGKVIIPFKIDSSQLSGSMEFYLNDKHWIDAFPYPEQHFSNLVAAVRRFMETDTSSADNLKKGTLPPPNKFLRIVEISVSSLLGMLGLMGCCLVVGAFLHVGNCGKGWQPWMFWVYPFLMPALLVIGMCLAQKHPVVTVKKHLFVWKHGAFTNFDARRVLIGAFRILAAWAFILFGLVWTVALPIFGICKFNDGVAITRDNLAEILSSASALVCWGYLLFKTGWALIDENWSKFHFTPKRFARCLFVALLPFLIAILVALIFRGR